MASEYETDAHRLAAEYEAIDPAVLHAWLLPFLPARPRLRVLDVGAGSGRDAAWLASQGHTVTAVEPAAAMRGRARELHPDEAITWLDDCLPGLATVTGPPRDLVLVMSTWMFVPPADRPAAFARLLDLLAADGLLAVTVRQPTDPERGMHPAAPGELAALAAAQGVRMVHEQTVPDHSGRDNVSWLQCGICHGTVKLC